MIYAVAVSYLLGTNWGCASAGFDMSVDEFEHSGPVAAGEWSLFVAFTGGPMGGNTWWNIRADSSGKLRVETRRWDSGRSQWEVVEDEVTVPPADLVRLLDAVELFAHAALPERVWNPLVSDANSVRIACWRGDQYDAVDAYAFEYLIEPMSRERSPEPDPEMAWEAAHVCLVLAQLLQVWRSPNDWQTADYYSDLAARAVAVINEQP